MTKLQFHFECLDGNYFFAAEADRTTAYTITSDIPELEEKSGELDEKATEAFLKELELSQIERWDRHYRAEQSKIEDAVKWSVTYEKEDGVYKTDGEESYEPYNYEHLIKALIICDEKAEYFLINK